MSLQLRTHLFPWSMIIKPFFPQQWCSFAYKTLQGLGFVFSVTITALGLTRRSCMAGKMGKGGELVSSKEDRMVSVPSKGSVSSGVGAVVNVVRTGGRVWGGVSIAASTFWSISFHGCVRCDEQQKIL